MLLEAQALQAHLGSLGRQVQLELADKPVVQACLVHTDFQVSRERSEHRERKEQWDRQDLLEPPVKMVSPASTVHLELLERRDHKARMVYLDRLARSVSPDCLETPARWAQPADQDRAERQGTPE